MLIRMCVLFVAAVAAGALWVSVSRAAEFPDVPIDNWAYDAVNYLQEEGFVIGYPDGTFKGDEPLTRYEFAMVVSRVYQQFLEKMDGPKGEQPPVDVQAIVNMLMKEFDPEIEELRGLINSNTERIGTLEGTVGGMDTKITDLNTRIDKIDTKVTQHGDLTLRFEGIYPKTGLRDQRPRFMLHYGVTTPITDELTMGARLASGMEGSRQSTFVTLGEGFGIKPVEIDQAYMQWTPKSAHGFTAWGGKFEPMWMRNPAMLDTDVMVEGLAEKYVHDNFNCTVAELVPTIEGYYLVGQLGYNNFGWKNNNVAVTYHFINNRAWAHIAADMMSGKLTNKFQFSELDNPSDYRAIEAYWEWKANAGTVPVKFQADALLNLAKKAAESDSAWTRAGWVRLTFLNAPANPGDWNVSGEYGRFEPNSILSWMADAWRGYGDSKFWAVQWNYRLLKSTDLNVSYVNTHRISNSDSFQDVLVNISTRFN